ncbi:MAG: hypothetical protein KF861_14415, partial [Planctomycetaceae bacterium]|nr:hypothetical protein [Planctomycetaceae bacterium]
MAALVQGGTLWPHAVARAEEAPPVAVDLVDLAVALADAAGAVQELGPQLEFAEQQRRKGFIP